LQKFFDEKVRNLFLLRLDTDYEISQTEFLIARLIRSIMVDMKRKVELEVLSGEMKKINDEVDEKKNAIEEFSRHIEFLQARIKSC